MDTHQFAFELGSELQDVITGFKGIATGRVNFITGCDQYVLQPPVDKKDGTIPKTGQFDDNRLKLLKKPVKLPAPPKEQKTNKPGGPQDSINMNPKEL